MSQIASLLAVSGDALAQAGNCHDWQAAPDSLAVEQLQDATSGVGVHAAIKIARALMIAAWEGLDVYGQLLIRQPPTLFVTFPVARMTVEALASANWLYEDVDASTRVKRSLALLIQAINMRRRSSVTDASQIGQALGTVQRLAEATGTELRWKDGVPAKVEGVSPPSTGQRVNLLFGDDQLGALVYWSMSDIAHANVAGLLRFLDDDDEEPGVTLDETDVRLLAATVIHAWWTATGRLVELMGWRSEAYTAQARSVDANLAAMLGPLRH